MKKLMIVSMILLEIYSLIFITEQETQSQIYLKNNELMAHINIQDISKSFTEEESTQTVQNSQMEGDDAFSQANLLSQLPPPQTNIINTTPQATIFLQTSKKPALSTANPLKLLIAKQLALLITN